MFNLGKLDQKALNNNHEHREPPPMMNTDNIKRKWLNVPYANQSPAQKLDIYLPDEGGGPFPVICEFHGGAWLFGDKYDIQQVPILRGLKRGYAVVCANYRLSGEALFPSQIFDCKAVIRFARSNAQKFHFDGSRIAVWGASAGAHLASLLGTSIGIKELEDLSMGNADTSSAVQAVVDWCGPCDNFIKMDEQFKLSGLGVADHSLPDSPESKLLGKHIVKAPKLVEFASPKTYANKNIPPFFIQHGSHDQVVPVEQSINFAVALSQAAGADKVTLEVIPGMLHHGDPAWDSVEMSDKVFKFLDQNL